MGHSAGGHRFRAAEVAAPSKISSVARSRKVRIMTFIITDSDVPVHYRCRSDAKGACVTGQGALEAGCEGPSAHGAKPRGLPGAVCPHQPDSPLPIRDSLPSGGDWPLNPERLQRRFHRQLQLSGLRTASPSNWAIWHSAASSAGIQGQKAEGEQRREELKPHLRAACSGLPLARHRAGRVRRAGRPRPAQPGVGCPEQSAALCGSTVGQGKLPATTEAGQSFQTSRPLAWCRALFYPELAGTLTKRICSK
jgi:hypothetical protein